MPRVPLAERVAKIEQRRAETSPLPIDNTALDQEVGAFAVERAKQLRLAERILFCRVPEIVDHCASGATWPSWVRIHSWFSESEMEVFAALNWDRQQIGREAGRVSGVIDWQRKAGKQADREAAMDRLNAAEEAMATRGPDLETEISRLQSELSGLRRDRQLAAADCDARAAAVAQLRKLIPAAVTRQHERELAKLQPLRLELSEAQTQLGNAVSIVEVAAAGGGLTALEKVKLICHTQRPDLLVVEGTPWKEELDFAGFLKFAKAREAEIPALESRVNELQARLESSISDVNALLDHYAG